MSRFLGPPPLVPPAVLLAFSKLSLTCWSNLLVSASIGITILSSSAMSLEPVLVEGAELTCHAASDLDQVEQLRYGDGLLAKVLRLSRLAGGHQKGSLASLAIDAKQLIGIVARPHALRVLGEGQRYPQQRLAAYDRAVLKHAPVGHVLGDADSYVAAALADRGVEATGPS